MPAEVDVRKRRAERGFRCRGREETKGEAQRRGSNTISTYMTKKRWSGTMRTAMGRGMGDTTGTMLESKEEFCLATIASVVHPFVVCFVCAQK